LSSRHGFTQARGKTVARIALRRSIDAADPPLDKGRNHQRANIAASSNIRCGV
jgi:hypothetical protein